MRNIKYNCTFGQLFVSKNAVLTAATIILNTTCPHNSTTHFKVLHLINYAVSRYDRWAYWHCYKQSN